MLITRLNAMSRVEKETGWPLPSQTTLTKNSTPSTSRGECERRNLGKLHRRWIQGPPETGKRYQRLS
jgi:hypothetical protein